MPKFIEGDPRIHKGGRPKKKTFSDILEGLGTVTIRDKETGKIIDKLEGNDRLLKEIVDVGIKEKNPAMMKFIYQHLNAPQYDGELLEIKKQVEKARAAKIELENEIKNKRAAMRAEMESYDAAIKKSRAEQEEMKTKKMTGAYIDFETMRYYFSFFQRAITDSYAGIKVTPHVGVGIETRDVAGRGNQIQCHAPCGRGD